MDLETQPQAYGFYVTQQTSTQQSSIDHGTCQAHAVLLNFMNGPQCLALRRLEVPAGEANNHAREAIEEIVPWGPALAQLAVVLKTKSARAQMATLLTAVREAAAGDKPLHENVREGLIARASAQEIELAKASGEPAWDGMHLARLIAMRLRRDLTESHLALLAAAPEVNDYPLHTTWELPPEKQSLPGLSAAHNMARELLAAWSLARDLRDPLITWAVTSANVTRTDAQRITSISCTTMNRLLPTD
ncbi:hypothetical protein [Streptomyces sp. NPDC090080]|uniref:hypothetical protein n=1 Tax=Streptomyces sp. NPDC090080 TaxID=3365939 RepID=UPI003824E25C